MPSDKERREVAARDSERRVVAMLLRRTASDSLFVDTFQQALGAITKAKDTSWRGIMRRLADLIEPARPTDEERREVAENLRAVLLGQGIYYKEQFYDELAEVTVGYEDHHGFDVVAEKLARLIDPEGGDDD